MDPSGGDGWAGLWRAGDVHAAADELFATFLPGLDGSQLRQLGAHLREAADIQDRAAGEHGDYARRGLRISRSLYGNGEISGRLHPEAAAQVIAAFDQLGRRTGPDDTRTKAQRWADVLTRLTGAAPGLPGAAPAPADPACDLADPASPGDDQPDDTNPHGDPDQPGGPAPAACQRPRIIVTVSLGTLLGRPLAPGATLGPGTPLTAEATRRMACDAEIIRLITSPERPSVIGPPGDATAQLNQLMAAAIAGLPPPLATPSAILDIGRKSPGWTPRQRDACTPSTAGIAPSAAAPARLRSSTTSSTGCTAAGPRSSTASRAAATTTGSSTKAAG